MDGRVLHELWADGNARTDGVSTGVGRCNSPVEVASPESYLPDSANGNGDYSAADEEKISERLKALGYIE
jgi:hypothetical protein